jgi:hypothetical protein
MYPNHLAGPAHGKNVTDCCLTTNRALSGLCYPVKCKQALLGSNLSGIAGAEKSRKHGTQSSGCVPTHHFGPYLRKPNATTERYLLSCHDSTLTTKKSVPDFSYCESLARICYIL